MNEKEKQLEESNNDSDPFPSRLFPAISPKRYLNSLKFRENINENDWNDWHWQYHSRFTKFEELKEIINLSENEIQILQKNPSLSITPYYASLIDKNDPNDPIRRTMIPTIEETIYDEIESEDPLDEEDQSPVPNLVHRYPDRVLFLTTNRCSNQCRYCTRSRIVGHDEIHVESQQLRNEAIDYIKNHKEIRDVILSGGDPLLLEDNEIGRLLKQLREIDHIEIIRIGTKIPIVMPQRITENLVNMLKKFHPLWINVHATHPEEITPEVSDALQMLANVGIPLGSQTVLLKGINDDIETLKKLYHSLLKNRVKPYYLYSCDRILGSKHFRTSLKKGIEIIKGLHGWTSGLAVPKLIFDSKYGKIPINPEYCIISDNKITINSYNDKTLEFDL